MLRKKNVFCHICHEVFPNLRAMLDHLRTEHGANGLKCPICKKRFGYVQSLGKHLRTVHGSAKFNIDTVRKSSSVIASFDTCQ